MSSLQQRAEELANQLGPCRCGQSRTVMRPPGHEHRLTSAAIGGVMQRVIVACPQFYADEDDERRHALVGYVGPERRGHAGPRMVGWELEPLAVTMTGDNKPAGLAYRPANAA